MESLKGKLLIASPRLMDPNFVRTVVLMVQHGDEGALAKLRAPPHGARALTSAPSRVRHSPR